MWNPGQYLQFEEERTRPAQDLCLRIQDPAPVRILDAGCGPGNSTRILRQRWPQAQVTGLDSSPAMIAKAKHDFPDGHWVTGDLMEFQAEPFDLVFSNAVIQWIPDHEVLIPRLLALTAPGGHLAVQVPANPHSPIRQAMEAAAQSLRFRDAMAGKTEGLTFHDARYYYERLAAPGRTVDLWETIYVHTLPTHQAIVDWMESTGMRPYLACLKDPVDQRLFKGAVLAACAAAFPPCRDGRILMPFQRLFFVVGT